MDKKNKVLAALAVGACVILVASGVARCSLGQHDPEKDQAKQPEATAPRSAAQERALAFSDYENTHWTSDDGKSTLDILPGIMVEKGPDSESFWYYELDDVKSGEGGLAATVKLSSELGGEAKEGVLSIVHGNGSDTLACDLLSAGYALPAEDAAGIELVNFDAGHDEFKGRTADDFAKAIGKAASARSPYAKSAAWSQEVWIDYAKGSAVTTFTLDDGARTTVSVTVTEGGELVAS